MEITPTGFATPISLGEKAQTQGRVPAKPKYETSPATTTSTTANNDDHIKQTIPADAAQTLVANVLLSTFPQLGATAASRLAKEMVGKVVDAQKADEAKAVEKTGTHVDVSA